LALFRGDGALLLPVAFVADQDLVDAFTGVLLDVGEPCSYVYFQPLVKFYVYSLSRTGWYFLVLHTVKALLIRHIVYEQDTHGAAVVGGGDGSKALLACGVPYLQFHSLAVQVNGADLEIYPNGGDETGCEAVFAEP
jgi:hypothetical protein